MSFWKKWLGRRGLMPKNYHRSDKNNINYYNWRYLFSGEKINPETEWFTLLLQNVKHRKAISFYSVFGERAFALRNCRRKKDSEISVFYTQENVADDTINLEHRNYSDNLLGFVDLSMGFDYVENPQYIRFPYWILEVIPPDSTFEDIANIVKMINSPSEFSYKDRNIDCSLIARHDAKGKREEISRLLSNVLDISFEGRWNNNSNVMKEEFGDEKIDYLRRCKFNICFENSNSFGYVTEKIFEALVAKTVPIYWGSLGEPEPEILNSSAFLYYEETNSDKIINEVDYLMSHPKAYEDFISQPKLKDGSEEVIFEKIDRIKKTLLKLDQI